MAKFKNKSTGVVVEVKGDFLVGQYAKDPRYVAVGGGKAAKPAEKPADLPVVPENTKPADKPVDGE